MPDWINYILVPLITALIGGLVGVIITIKWENKQREKEKIDKALPIIINYPKSRTTDNQVVLLCVFQPEGSRKRDYFRGVFKNTGNGIVFFDSIETKTQTYYPVEGSVVDKDTEFRILIGKTEGETLNQCIINCHDIYGNRYYYNAHFCFDSDCRSEIIIDSNQPIKKKRKRR